MVAPLVTDRACTGHTPLLLLLLLQVWALEGGGVDSKDTAALLEGGGVDSKDTAALLPHMLWCLGADGQPDGSTFNSCSGGHRQLSRTGCWLSACGVQTGRGHSAAGVCSGS